MDYRSQFRFLPWFSAATAASPTSEPLSSRPEVKSSAPAQPRTSIPTWRPPFRLPGIAPAQAAPRASDARPSTAPQASPATPTPRPMSPDRAASVPPSPSQQASESKTSAPSSDGATQTRVAVSQARPPSPAATEPAHPTSETRAASLPPSPSRRATEPRTSQPASPARKTTQSPAVVSKTRSPSRATNEPARPTSKTRASSVPPSPPSGAIDSRTSQAVSPATDATQTKAAPSQTGSASRPARHPKSPSLPRSPSQVAKLQATVEKASKVQSPSSSALHPTGRKNSHSSSPSRKEMQMKPTVGAVHRRQSPLERSETAKEESSKPVSPTRPLPSQQEPKLVASLTQSLDAQPRTEGVSKAQEKTTIEQPLQVMQPEKETAAAVLKLDKKAEEKATPYKLVKEEKTKASDGEGAQQRTTLELSTTTPDATAKSKELPRSASEAGRIHQQKQEAIGRSKTWITTSGDEKDIKITSSALPKDNNKGNDNHKKHVADNGERIPLHQGIREDISSLVQSLATEHTKLRTNEKPISVITLAGENKGASMHLGSESAKKDGSVHIYRGYKLNPDESPDFTSDAEGSSKGRKHGDSTAEEDSARQAYINSNVQGINNSIMFSSSVSERNPGVHLVFSETLTEAPKPSAKTEPPATRKDELNVTRAEKLTYEPTVRRRCLRALFLESSDSEPENPAKPRRHGCRYGCGGKGKEKEISVL